MLTKHLNKDKP